MVVQPNSLANLQPQWVPGESGNHNGRPNTGGSLIEYVHELGVESAPRIAKYTLGDLRDIAADEQCSHPRGIAAQVLVLARTPGFHEKSGKPYCAMLVDMILDRTIGKPHQSIHVTGTETRVPAAIGADVESMLAEMMTTDPGLLGRAMANMEPDARTKAIVRLPVDTTAEPIETLPLVDTTTEPG